DFGLGLIQTSASAISPLSGSKKIRVLPVVDSELKASFSIESAIVIKLTPSPADDGLTEFSGDQVTTKLILAILDQRASDLLAAPTTSVPLLMFDPGLSREVEKDT